MPFKLAGFSMKNLQVASLAGFEVPPRSWLSPADTVIGLDASVQSPASAVSNRLLPKNCGKNFFRKGVRKHEEEL